MSKAPKLPKGIRMRGDKFYVDVSHKGVRKGGTYETLEEATEARKRRKK